MSRSFTKSINLKVLSSRARAWRHAFPVCSLLPHKSQDSSIIYLISPSHPHSQSFLVEHKSLLWLPICLRHIAENLLSMRTQTLRSTQPVGLLADENLIPRGRGRYFLRQARRIWKSVGLLGLLVSCGVLLLPRQHDAAKPDSPPVQNVVADLHEDHILHVLLPTRRIPMETCRTILSGAALNYPNPWLISWHADVDEQMNDLGGDLAKLESILAFLEIQAPTRNEDTVIVLANSNSWFQARPEVLLKRYRSIQQEPQHQSLRQNPTRALWESQHKKENIVLSTERKCLSRPDADCLPVQAADNTLRFVSHSFVMGPIEQVRLFYR